MRLIMWAILIVLGASTPAVSGGYGCKKSLRTGDDSRDFVLFYHNVLRENIARNLQSYNFGKSKLGPASNMYELEWDCKLEEAAEKIADTCDVNAKDVHAQNGVKFKGDTRYNAMSNFFDAMSMFTGDLWFYDGTITNVFKDANLSIFANIAYSKTTKMGCSYKWCEKDKFFVVCLYNRLGNRLGNVLWEEGKHCLKDEECTTYPGSTCNYQGLCVDAAHADDVYEEEEKKEIQTTAPAEIIVPNPEGIIGSCPTDNGMTNEIRKVLLDKHNGYRTLVAKGEAENPLGSSTGYAPKAARMRKMVYDCNIEINAMKHADGCKFAHSSGGSRPGLGENLWAMWGPANYSLLKAAEGATRSWFSELKKPGMPEDNRLTMEVWNRPEAIGHYTQVVWQSTYHLGCGLKNCPGNMCLAVCQYGPPEVAFIKEWDCKLDEEAQKIADTCNEKAKGVYAQNSVKLKGDTRYNEMTNFMDTMVRFTGDLWLYQGTITNVLSDTNLSIFANAEQCTTYAGSTCNNKGLCVDAVNVDNVYEGEKKEEIETTTQPPTEKAKPIVTNPELIIGDCPTDSGMNSEIRKVLLDKHNGYRCSYDNVETYKHLRFLK